MSTSNTSFTPPTFSQMGKIHRVFTDHGVSSSAVQDLIRSGLLADLAESVGRNLEPQRESVRNSLGLESLEIKGLDGYKFFVDCDLSQKQAIDAGHYHEVNDILWQALFAGAKAKKTHVTAKLIKRHKISSDNSETIRNLRLRHGTFRELLAFGAAFPKVQLESPIFAIGCGSLGLVPYLTNNGSDRILDVCKWEREAISFSQGNLFLMFPLEDQAV